MNIQVARFLKLLLITVVFHLILYKTDGSTNPEEIGRILDDLNKRLDIIVRFIIEIPGNMSKPMFEKFSNFAARNLFS